MDLYCKYKLVGCFGMNNKLFLEVIMTKMSLILSGSLVLFFIARLKTKSDQYPPSWLVTYCVTSWINSTHQIDSKVMAHLLFHLFWSKGGFDPGRKLSPWETRSSRTLHMWGQLKCPHTLPKWTIRTSVKRYIPLQHWYPERLVKLTGEAKDN